MKIAPVNDLAPVIEQLQDQLREVAIVMEGEIVSVVRIFEGLAGHMNSVVQLAAGIVQCVENENISSVLPRVQELGEAARSFIADQLQATHGILETVLTEVTLLRQLSQLTAGQETIALETKALSVLTNVEAARLGAMGAGFQFLARELCDFSEALTNDTQRLAVQTEARRTAIENAKAVLSAELPGLRENLTQVEHDLGRDLGALDQQLTALLNIPGRFRGSVEHTAQQISGVVSAVQAHDITRQQIEHIVAALAIIVGMSKNAAGGPSSSSEQELSATHAGLTIQLCQLKVIKDTVEGWVSQVKLCIRAILEVSASELVNIARRLLEQEREVSAHLAHIEILERQSQAYGAKIQRTLGGLSNLMHLVAEHRQKSKAARAHLRMLSFNSIIEATQLGANAGAILAIAGSIKEMSVGWSEIEDQSAFVMRDMSDLSAKTATVMEAFSDASNQKLHNAQLQTAAVLDQLRNAAAFASGQAKKMESITGQIQSNSEAIANPGKKLDDCLRSLDLAVEKIECMHSQLEMHDPDVRERYDLTELERLFAPMYTMEVERAVLNAVLGGAPLPEAPRTFAGNSVELF